MGIGRAPSGGRSSRRARRRRTVSHCPTRAGACGRTSPRRGARRTAATGCIRGAPPHHDWPCIVRCTPSPPLARTSGPTVEGYLAKAKAEQFEPAARRCHGHLLLTTHGAHAQRVAAARLSLKPDYPGDAGPGPSALFIRCRVVVCSALGESPSKSLNRRGRGGRRGPLLSSLGEPASARRGRVLRGACPEPVRFAQGELRERARDDGKGRARQRSPLCPLCPLWFTPLHRAVLRALRVLCGSIS